MRRILFSETDFNSLPNPPAYFWQFDNFGNLIFPDSSSQSTAWSGGRVVSNPTASVGSAGDKLGDMSFSSTYLYYCTQDHDGTTNVWKRISWSGDTW